jgi:hypothetical protein
VSVREGVATIGVVQVLAADRAGLRSAVRVYPVSPIMVRFHQFARETLGFSPVMDSAEREALAAFEICI